jgi:hypothetical protein
MSTTPDYEPVYRDDLTTDDLNQLYATVNQGYRDADNDLRLMGAVYVVQRLLDDLHRARTALAEVKPDGSDSYEEWATRNLTGVDAGEVDNEELNELEARALVQHYTNGSTGLVSRTITTTPWRDRT